MSTSPSATELDEGTPKPPSFFDTLQRVTKKTQVIGKSLVVLLAVLYGLGLFVSSQHLMTLGVSDFSAVRPKYVVTGMWAAMLLLIAALPALASAMMWRYVRPELWKQWSTRLTWVLLFLMSAFFAWILINLIFLTLAISSKPNVRLIHLETLLQSRGIIPLVACVNGGFFVAAFLWLYTRGVSKPTEEAPKKPTEGGITDQMELKVRLGVFFCLGIYVACFAFFTIHKFLEPLYVQVPESIGGGKPVVAQMILNKDGLAFWKQTEALVPEGKESTRTGPIRILYQNEHEFVIKAPYKDGQEKIIIIKKSLVEGILPEEEEQP
jgi:hypothetical protein